VKGNTFGLRLMEVAAIALIAVFLFDLSAADQGFMGSNSTSANASIAAVESHSAKRGFFFDESSSVSGAGQVSIKGSFRDNALDSSGWMKGSGSISLESLRSMDKAGREVEFLQKSDLVFAGGLLKNKKSMSLPLFEKGRGATVSERFNLSHLDRSESNVIRSYDRHNNSMVFDTALAFDGKWDIENRRGWSIFMNRSKQSYTGSFQTEKKIQFDDSDLV